jgi:inner membrane protein
LSNLKIEEEMLAAASKRSFLKLSDYQVTHLPNSSLPTAFTHALVAGSLGQAGKAGWRADWRFWYVAVLCSILPDVDILGFRFGIHYGDLWGHRGMTHSLLFAAILSIVMAFRFGFAAAERWKMTLLLFVITASHGLLDAMTNGGLVISTC